MTTSDRHLKAILTSIQDEYECETGDRPSSDVAEILLDRMCDAFVHKLSGAGAEYAVRDDMRVAEYLVVQWADKPDAVQLRAAIDKIKAEPRIERTEPPKRHWSEDIQSRHWCAACCIAVSVHAKTEVDQATHERACDLLQHQIEAMPMLPLVEDLPYPMNWQAWVAYVREYDAKASVNP